MVRNFFGLRLMMPQSKGAKTSRLKKEKKFNGFGFTSPLRKMSENT